MADPIFSSPRLNPFGLEDVGDFAAPSFADIDNDGDRDLFIGTIFGVTLFYRNQGNSTIPDFVRQTGNFGIGEMVFSAAPIFVDIDNDNDMDVFVGEFAGTIQFFRNTGTSGAPQFVGESGSFGLTDVGDFAQPAFADIDGDGDLDAFVGERYGQTLFFRNDGTAQAPVFSQSTDSFGLTDIGDFAKPAFVDIDGDGDLDAFIGERYGNTFFFRNTGTALAPIFVKQSGNFGIADVGYSAKPAFADIDNDGDQDVWVGNSTGNVTFFENTLLNRPALTEPAAVNYTDTPYDDTFSTAGGQLTATDADGDILRYGIIGGIDLGNGNVRVVSALGALTLAKANGAYSFAGNDQAIEALTTGTNLTFTVFVSDGTLTDSRSLIVRIDQNGITESNGNDNLRGTTANDTFNALAGNDIINGLAGADIMRGGSGNDVYWVDNPADKVIETSPSSSEIDRVNSAVTWTLSANVELLQLIGNNAINGFGNALNNSLQGNSAANVLNGKEGIDTLNGGSGNDTYWVDNVGDRIIENSTLVTEIDRVVSTVTYSLRANIENLQLIGTAHINGNGNGLANSISGNGGNNILNGGEGNDILTGGLGKDIFRLTTLSRDRLTDFNAADDTIQLENSVFSQLTATGVLAAGNFKIGVATDGDDYLLYDSVNGVLTYDNNGNVAGGATQIAILAAGLALTNADFWVI